MNYKHLLDQVCARYDIMFRTGSYGELERQTLLATMGKAFNAGVKPDSIVGLILRDAYACVMNKALPLDGRLPILVPKWIMEHEDFIKLDINTNV